MSGVTFADRDSLTMKDKILAVDTSRCSERNSSLVTALSNPLESIEVGVGGTIELRCRYGRDEEVGFDERSSSSLSSSLSLSSSESSARALRDALRFLTARDLPA
jgi:hypothetical protein